jgi:SET domain
MTRASLSTVCLAGIASVVALDKQASLASYNNVEVAIDAAGDVHKLLHTAKPKGLDVASPANATQLPVANAHVWTGDCGLWLAPSTLQGAGLGMYAGRDFTQHEDMQATGDLVIPIVDIAKHTEQRFAKYSFLWDEYTWNAEHLLMHWEGHSEVNAASPGFGSAANCFLPLVNVEEQSLLSVDTAGLHRSRDPGVGGFTPYHNRRSTAKASIMSGQELFVSYGDHWFETRESLGPIPLTKDLDKANKLVKALYKLEFDADIPRHVLMDAWDVFVKQTPYTSSRVLGSFHHEDPDEVASLKQKDLKSLRVQESRRSTEWLQQHGTCADHIYANTSTIKQAGRGAMASRHLPAKTVIAHVPLIHIINKDVLKMYEPTVDDNEEVTINTDKQIGHQLLLNYCYGHTESSLLLCPYGPMVNLINHSPQPNARLVWANKGNHMPHLLARSIDHLERDATAKLAMDIVALRDIQQDEEVTIDYGADWAAAWNKHVQDWQPNSVNYTSAAEMNSKSTRIRTAFEQLRNPYPSNINIYCSAMFEDVKIWKRLYDQEKYEELIDEYYPCDVLRYTTVNDTIYYTAVIRKPGETEDEENHVLLENVPRLALRFTDAPYSTDMFLYNAFRHEIGIPDDIFPEAWRNLREKQT